MGLWHSPSGRSVKCIGMTKIVKVSNGSSPTSLSKGLEALGASVTILDYGIRWELMGVFPSGLRLHLIPSKA